MRRARLAQRLSYNLRASLARKSDPRTASSDGSHQPRPPPGQASGILGPDCDVGVVPRSCAHTRHAQCGRGAHCVRLSADQHLLARRYRRCHVLDLHIYKLQKCTRTHARTLTRSHTRSSPRRILVVRGVLRGHLLQLDRCARAARLALGKARRRPCEGEASGEFGAVDAVRRRDGPGGRNTGSSSESPGAGQQQPSRSLRIASGGT